MTSLQLMIVTSQNQFPTQQTCAIQQDVASKHARTVNLHSTKKHSTRSAKNIIRNWETNSGKVSNAVPGGVRARGGNLTILKFFDQIPQGRKRKVNQMCQKSPTPGEKSKQYYDNIY